MFKVVLAAGAALLLTAGAAVAAAPAAKGPPGTIPLDIKDPTGKPVFGNPTTGKTIFNTCGTCHSVAAGQNKVGPSLHGIIGRHSGSVPNFRYSAGNKNSGIIWSEQKIYDYLYNPQKMVPGTFMTFTGYKDSQKRADVIAYLQTATK